MLFPWARAEVFGSRYGLKMLAPRWVQPKVGPLLRREKDLRFYAGLFDNTRGGYVGGLRRAVILARGNQVPQDESDAFMAGRGPVHRTHIVVFKGWEGWFAGLVSHRELIARRLETILSDGVRERLAQPDAGYEIAVHIRRGDKAPIPLGQAMSGSSVETLPEEWYVRAIRSVRAALGEGARVRVFTDAREGQIESVFREPGVERAQDNPSIVDILLLSRGKVLIATGGSSFSAWASFLGGMPTIWYPGSGLALIEGRSELSIEAGMDGSLSDAGARVVRQGS